ncbi:MAG TPA: primosomal protein N', partial [Candidatus Halomonas stercoripullorum]|nr:primosomal protein N' [Candidatus Halomonas stercoripullorum]
MPDTATAGYSNRVDAGGQLPDSSFCPPPRVLRVAIPTPLRRVFDYRPGTDAPPGGWQPGVRVQVPFGRRRVVGVVVECASHSDLSLDQLKTVEGWLDAEPLPEDWLWLCRFTARYYQHSLGDTLHQAMPVLLRQGRPLAGRVRKHWRALALPQPGDTRLQRAPRQAELLAMLAQHPQGLYSPAILAQGFSHTQLQALVDKGLVVCTEEPAAAAPPATEQLLAEPAL